MIRVAKPDDALAVTNIWNHAIRETTITFNPVEKSRDEVAGLISTNCLILEREGQIHGFARYFPFRAGEGYRFTVEHTIMLKPDVQGQGGGRALLRALLQHAKNAGMKSMFAGCSGENPSAVRFHAAMGFRTVATLGQVGFKFDRWIDLILMQKRL